MGNYPCSETDPVRSKPRRRGRKIVAAVVGILGAGLAGASAVSYIMAGENQIHAYLLAPTNRRGLGSRAEHPTLKLMTLNLAHGRKDVLIQVSDRRDQRMGNLDDVAGVLRRESPDLVALQEADGPAFWSGKFDHVRYLAEEAGFADAVRAEHVRISSSSCGTALMSMLPLRDPLSITFPPSPPTGVKGLLLCTINWPGDPDVEIDVASVHLDFARGSVRQKQAREIVAALSGRERPLILMGDFNCDWDAEESALKTLSESLKLKAYRPQDPDVSTLPLLRRRLDWILISPELRFVNQRVLPDTLSDHLAVVSEIRMQQTPTPLAD